MELSALATLCLIFLPLITDASNFTDPSKEYGKVPVVKKIANCTAPTIYSPVCASNGINYLNRAVFDCADNQAGGALKLLHHGSCQGYAKEANQAGRESIPLRNGSYFSIFLWILSVVLLR